MSKGLSVVAFWTGFKPQFWYSAFFIVELPHPYICSDQFSSFSQSYPTLCDHMDHRSPSLPVHHQLPESTQTHAHWVCYAIQPFHPLSSPCPPSLNLSQHQGLFPWVSSSHQLGKVLEFQLQQQFFKWTSRTDLLKMEWLHFLKSKGFSRVFSKITVQKHHLFFSSFYIVQLSHSYMTTGEIITLTRQTFVGQVMSLLFNRQCRLLINFLSKRKHLLIPWLQSPSAVIWIHHPPTK